MCTGLFFLVAYHSSVDVLDGTQFMNFHYNCILCIELLMEFTKGTVSLLGNASKEVMIIGLKFTDLYFYGATTDERTKSMDIYPDIMRHKVALYKHVTLLSLIQVHVKVDTKFFGLIQRELKNSL